MKDPPGGPRGQIMEGLSRLTKTIARLQAAVSLMILNKNLLFSTLIFQITNDFGWKAQAK